MEFDSLRSLFTYAGPGVGMGFFMGWYFVSKKYLDTCTQVIKENTAAITELSTIIQERLPHD